MSNDNFIHKQLETLDKNIRVISSDTKDIRDKVSDTREEVIKIGTHVEVHDEKIKTAHKEINGVKGRVNNLEKKMSNAAGWVAGISASVSTIFMIAAQFWKKFF